MSVSAAGMAFDIPEEPGAGDFQVELGEIAKGLFTGCGARSLFDRDSNVKSAAEAALADGRITANDVRDFVGAAYDQGDMTDAEKAVLVEVLKTRADRFEPAARQALAGFLGVRDPGQPALPELKSFSRKAADGSQIDVESKLDDNRNPAVRVKVAAAGLGRAPVEIGLGRGWVSFGAAGREPGPVRPQEALLARDALAAARRALEGQGGAVPPADLDVARGALDAMQRRLDQALAPADRAIAICPEAKLAAETYRSLVEGSLDPAAARDAVRFLADTDRVAARRQLDGQQIFDTQRAMTGVRASLETWLATGEVRAF